MSLNKFEHICFFDFEASTDTEDAENKFGFGTCSAYSLRDLILLSFCRIQTKELYDKVIEIIGA